MEKILNQIAKEKAIRNKIYYNPLNNVNSGIIFLYSSWSPTLGRFKILLNSLKEYSGLPVYVFDIDDNAFDHWSKKNSIISHGYGEVFWVKDDDIIKAKLKGDASEEEFTLYNQELNQKNDK